MVDKIYIGFFYLSGRLKSYQSELMTAVYSSQEVDLNISYTVSVEVFPVSQFLLAF